MKNNSLKIIVGAGTVKMAGWISLQFKDLDIRNYFSWIRLFRPNSIDAILTEHTLEHLTIEEAKAAIRNFYIFLKKGGYVRVAVPDGFNRNANYLNWVSPSSRGEKWLSNFRDKDEPNHKTLWNYRTLCGLFAQNNFKVFLLEWFDERGKFNQKEWQQMNGFIRRCQGCFQSVLLSVFTNCNYTSLIFDAVKR
jgi:predicted SAM-dependent methyltransferase